MFLDLRSVEYFGSDMKVIVNEMSSVFELRLVREVCVNVSGTSIVHRAVI